MSVCARRRVLVALAVAVWGIGSTAFAVTPVFVDAITPNCHGRGILGVNCFTTIQQAVDHAGPPPAVVNVFQGTYAEDVDLSAMGSAIGGMPGDITLRTVNAAGLPASGTATIEGVQSAIGLTAIFNGSVTIDGFILTSQMGAGIDLFTVIGAVEIANVSVEHAGNSGVIVGASDTIDVRNTKASANGMFGFDLGSSQAIALRSLVANANQMDGIAVSSSQTVTIETATASGNQGSGADVSSGGAALIHRLTVEQNGSAGAGVSAAGTIEIEDSAANGNRDDGLDLSALGAVVVYDSTADRNRINGLSVSTMNALTITRTSASDNRADGMNLSSANGPTVSHARADGNQDDGIVVSTPRTVTITDSSASMNMGHGLNISAGQAITIGNTDADDNGGSGIRISSASDVTIDPTSASRNQVDGVDLSIGGHATITALAATDNTGFGVTISTPDGLSLGSSNLLRNASGLRLQGPGTASFEVHCSNIAQNTSSGLDSETTASSDAENNWWGSNSGPQHPSNPGGTGNPVIDAANGGAGTVDFKPFLRGPFQNVGTCGGRISQAPLLDGTGLAACAIALFALGYAVLERRARRPQP